MWIMAILSKLHVEVELFPLTERFERDWPMSTEVERDDQYGATAPYERQPAQLADNSRQGITIDRDGLLWYQSDPSHSWWLPRHAASASGRFRSCNNHPHPGAVHDAEGLVWAWLDRQGAAVWRAADRSSSAAICRMPTRTASGDRCGPMTGCWGSLQNTPPTAAPAGPLIL